MEGKSKPEKKEKKLSYDELKDISQKLYNTNIELNNRLKALTRDNENLIARLKQVDNVMTILPMMFEVLKYADRFSSEFVQTCVSNIETIMTLQEEQPTEDNNSQEAN